MVLAPSGRPFLSSGEPACVRPEAGTRVVVVVGVRLIVVCLVDAFLLGLGVVFLLFFL